jgi:hypothetical protein
VISVRRNGLGIAGILGLAFGGLVFAFSGTAAATTVSTEAELRAAFGDPAETSIVLANDIVLENCDAVTGGDVDRDSGTALTLDGTGHMVRQQCEGERVFEQAGTGELTFTNIAVTNGDQIGFSSDQEGGGIRAGGDVILLSANISGNLLTGQNPHGGGVFAVGDIVVTNSILEGNRAFDPGDAIDARGGAFFTFSGDITITDSILRENEARSPLFAVGGAFWTIDGDVDMVRSSMLENAIVGSDVFGGGGGTQNGSFTIISSTIAGNTATGGEGNASAAALGGQFVFLGNSTVSGNQAVAQDTGAAIRAEQVTLVYSTVVSNTGEESANIDVSDGSPTQLTSFGSVVALPIGGPNCDLNGSTTDTHGFNYSDDGTCGFTLGSDIPNGSDPLLGPLGPNGGPTPTRVPEPGSPLLDWVGLSACQADGANGVTTDQRNLPRPSGPGCDIGAVEVQVQAIPLQPNFTG